MKKNLLVAQSGGPTAVINASLSGVIREALRQEKIEEVYGARYGIEGVFQEDFLNLGKIVKEQQDLLQHPLQLLAPVEKSCKIPRRIPQILRNCFVFSKNGILDTFFI